LPPFATDPAPHAWIMEHPDVATLILAFLEHGRFPD
jgi:hypothetical protein